MSFVINGPDVMESFRKVALCAASVCLAQRGTTKHNEAQDVRCRRSLLKLTSSANNFPLTKPIGKWGEH